MRLWRHGGLAAIEALAAVRATFKLVFAAVRALSIPYRSLIQREVLPHFLSEAPHKRAIWVKSMVGHFTSPLIAQQWL